MLKKMGILLATLFDHMVVEVGAEDLQVAVLFEQKAAVVPAPKRSVQHLQALRLAIFNHGSKFTHQLLHLLVQHRVVDR